MKRKAFTFAELMISLVVIAVITAILYPTISELAPNNNKHLFKAAYKTVELVVSEIVANDEDGTIGVTAAELCPEFKRRLNFTDGGACTDAGCPCVDNGFQTSNGMRWLFADDGVIYVDVNASNNKKDSSCADNLDNYVDDWDKGNFCGTEVVTDTFKIQVLPTGRVNVETEIGRRHLINVTED